MAILSFKKQFVEPIRKGTKQQTIRAFRKHPIKAGERLYLYTGLRTKHAQKIGEAICTDTYNIAITKKGIAFYDHRKKATVPKQELDQYARQDGFESWEHMRKFWVLTHQLPFKGTLILWHNFIPA